MFKAQWNDYYLPKVASDGGNKFHYFSNIACKSNFCHINPTREKISFCDTNASYAKEIVFLRSSSTNIYMCVMYFETILFEIINYIIIKGLKPI